MNKSFTLIEILVVIVVIGVLSAFIFVGMSSITSSANIAKVQVFTNSLDNSLLLARVSQWKLDQINGTSPATTPDSWNLNTGTLMDGADNTCVFGSSPECPQPVTSGCVSGSCLFFDGSNDYVDCGNDLSLSVSNVITISAWIKVSGFSTTRRIVTKFDNNDGTYDGYSMMVYSGGTLLQIYKLGTGNDAGIAHNVPLNVFSCITYVYDGTNKKLYMDGVYIGQAAAGATSIGTTATTLRIGGTFSGAQPFYGIIDDVRIYNQVLSTSQIQQNYYVGISKLFKNNEITLNEFNQRIVELKNNIVNNE